MYLDVYLYASICIYMCMYVQAATVEKIWKTIVKDGKGVKKEQFQALKVAAVYTTTTTTTTTTTITTTNNNDNNIHHNNDNNDNDKS